MDEVIVMRKKDIMHRLDCSIPDDAFVIIPAFGLNGQMVARNNKHGKYHDPFFEIRCCLSSDILTFPDDIGVMRNSVFMPLMWLDGQLAKRYITQEGHDLADKKKGEVSKC